MTHFETEIIKVGINAHDALLENMMILFREGAPADIQDYCFIHQHGTLTGHPVTGSTLQLGERCYAVTAIGEVAIENLRELGHITVVFDGQPTAQLPGSIHVSGKAPDRITTETSVKLFA
ncbi:PTS system glucitol/sorbitol-specific IIA component [Pantoea sp. PA1]|jgi:PTS system glucitol/sorbitol-specific IIA component|nr:MULTISPECIES: PTS glucitol/sorbitol transporter subunit IIA [Pantoea]AER33855.1 glucitol/sorbitol-specific phosphotransferase IIA component SrlB [Pantoea ananatis PA13]AMB74791.1 PTS glucitol/sorbitol transporter subunit IIA [Pantoea ananatis]ASN16349.1 PTS glucitol/sorbitol transporter subunit IIA [Pantoea ananatis]AVG75907.1 PTS glucitol/sorbitol transporter subunit IIA [Pantoea ananatis]ERM14421.1 PTS sorbitol transporter subunit IIA [Pantoea ananatis BRT175]